MSLKFCVRFTIKLFSLLTDSNLLLNCYTFHSMIDRGGCLFEGEGALLDTCNNPKSFIPDLLNQARQSCNEIPGSNVKEMEKTSGKWSKRQGNGVNVREME